MAPSPMDEATKPDTAKTHMSLARYSKPAPEEEIVISGIAGHFPESRSVKELETNLFNKVDLVTDDDRRWRKIFDQAPHRVGKINDVEKMDGSFFGLDFKEVHNTEPMSRNIMERVVECLIDAGLNPNELQGTNTAVFVGVCFNEYDKYLVYDRCRVNDNAYLGCSRSMMATRIARWLGLRGPTCAADSACSSSMYALDIAYKSLRDGLCDAAIVCGTNICLNPRTSVIFGKLGVLSPDGSCKCFDEKRNGYARSESIVVCFLQKAKDSRRIYAKLVHTKTNCDGFKTEGITYPSGQIQQQLLEAFYAECGVPPASVEFVEAHGTGTFVGDPEELHAITEVFCRDREGPLLVGSVKSNLGHSEASSGLNSLAKIIIAYNTGYIPPNINYHKARDDCPSLLDGRVEVVTEKRPWNKGLVAMSSFGFGGANAHILLDSFSKPKVNKGLPADSIPRLVCVSARTASGVARILDELESRAVDVEEVRLWHAVFQQDVAQHRYRGYTLLGSTPMKSVRLARDVTRAPAGGARRVCFKYTDLRFHWPVVAKQLMILPVFATAVERCAKILKKINFDLPQLFNGGFAKQRNWAVVGATTVYIGLTDLLISVGIEPDFITSDDFGELCCAYADGCISTEQAILAAYDIDAVLKDMLLNQDIIKVYDDARKILDSCPSSLQLEYDHDEHCSIVIGPSQDIKTFGNVLLARKIKVEYPGFYNATFTKYYLKDAGRMKGRVPPMANRSKRWPTQTSDVISSAGDGIVIEIGLHENILVNSKSTENTITLCAVEMDNTQHTLSALGRLYQLGVNARLANIYPEVSFPVSQTTPFLSHLIEWDHQDNWIVARSDSVATIPFGFRFIPIEMTNENQKYIYGHAIDGRVLYPATGYLLLVWESFALMQGMSHNDLSVVFKDVYLLKATHIPKEGKLSFFLTICPSSGKFEITESNATVVTGIIRKKHDDKIINYNDPEETVPVMMNTKDFYKELNIRGYEYKGMFRGVRSCSIDGRRGRVAWDNNWVTFLDTLLQTNILAEDTRNLYVPTRIERVLIDTDAHKRALAAASYTTATEEETTLPFTNCFITRVTRAGGVEIRRLHCSAISKKPPKGIPIHEKNCFVLNFSADTIQIDNILRSNLQLIHENIQTYKFKTVELVDEEYERNDLEPISEKIGDVLADLPLVQAEMLILSNKADNVPSNITVENKKTSSETNNTLFIGANLINKPDRLREALSTLKKGCFLISRERSIPNALEFSRQYDIITIHYTGSEFIVLIRDKISPLPTKYIKIVTEDQSYSWIDKVKTEMKEAQKLVLYSEKEPVNGLLGLVNCLRKEPGGEMVYGVLIADNNAPPFNPNCEFYKEQLDKCLALNVFKDGQWGTYRHLLLEDLDTIPAAHAYVNIATIGDMSSLRWWEGKYSEKQTTSNPNLALVEVYSAALNFRDVMVSLGRVTVDAVARGRLAQDCVQGLEFAGRTPNGSRIMGCGNICIANLVEIDLSGQGLYWPLLDEWTFDEAVTIPVVYSTVYMALIMIGRAKRGESILIHAGSGGVGQAAISVALHHGLQVFTTVGSQAKRDFIKKLFPHLKDSHIGNSRDTSFEHMIQKETNGRGVDMVLNSLAEDILLASVNCLANGGRFLEIGKYDITVNTQIETCFLKKEISFHGIMLDYIGDPESYMICKKLQQLVLQGIESGAVRPLTYCTFDKDAMEPAYRYMAAGKHIGKVIIKIRDEEPRGVVVKPKSLPIDAIPRYMCGEEEVFVLVGGLGGFGLELADWLVLRGARRLLLASRRGVSGGYQALRIRIWESYGVKVKISTADVTTEAGCADMLRAAATMGPVRAVFNLAVVLNDAVFENQTPETFRNSFGPKASTTIHLDKLTRKMCPQLKEFVIFSSVSCGRGNAGQTNYGFSNSVMERICEERKAVGLPALAVQWGAVGDVGLVADMQEENVQLEIGGTLQQRIVSCLQAMDKFLKQDSPIVSSIVVAEKRSSNSGGSSVVDVIAQILGISDLKSVSMQAPMSEMGMDSVMAVEIKQTLERDYEIFLSAQEVRMLSFAKLSSLAASDAPAEDGGSTVTENSAAAVGQGLEMLIKNFGDEKLASEPYIYLDSAVSKSTSERLVFLLPGLESCASTFEGLCSKLDARTCVLQLGLNAREVALTQIVDKLHKTVTSQLRPGAPFVLLGYSFGSLPVLELAARLESEGHKGLVFCLDGSPEYIKTLAKTYVYSVDNAQVENLIICHSFNTVCPNYDAHATLSSKLAQLQSFEDKVKCALELCPVKLDYSHEYMYAIARVCCNRVKMVAECECSALPSLRSPVVLVRPHKPPVAPAREDYGLGALAAAPVTVHKVQANHSNIVDNHELPHIINDALVRFFGNNEKEIMRHFGMR